MEPDVRAIRESAQISQSQFATLVGANLRTLQNREQHRTRPTGPARALLRIVASDPKSAIEALHAWYSGIEFSNRRSRVGGIRKGMLRAWIPAYAGLTTLAG